MNILHLEQFRHNRACDGRTDGRTNILRSCEIILRVCIAIARQKR